MNVFTYWEGPKTAYIDLCHQTLRRHNGDDGFTVYSPDLVRQRATQHLRSTYLDDPYFSSLMPAHRADIIRVELLAAYGGCWIDSDFISMNSFSPLIRSARNRDALYYYSEKYGPTNGVLVSPSGHSMIVEWGQKNLSVFRNLKRMGIIPSPDDRWTSWGKDQLNVVIANSVDPHADLGWDRVQPISYEDLGRFFDTDDIDEKAWTGCYGYMLYNTMFPAWFKQLTHDEILSGPWLISELFRRALGTDHGHVR
jgi:Capsular polysaccharide synthesis protein